MTNTAGDTNFDWAPLGEARWRELAQSAGASELQLRFAVARFNGATQTGAARLAGYSGDKDALRRSGYAAARSTAVADLIELASVNAPIDAKITEREIDAKIAKLVRSPDAGVALKAVEIHQKRAAAQKASGRDASDDDTFNNRPDLFYARWLEKLGEKRGPVIVSLLAWYAGGTGKGFDAFYFAPFLQELAPYVAADFPDVWKFLCENIPENDWERQCFPEAATKPRKPIAEIVGKVKARYERLDADENNAA